MVGGSGVCGSDVGGVSVAGVFGGTKGFVGG